MAFYGLRLAVLVLVGLAAEGPYRQALPGYQYRFPRDHFAHSGFRTEWWYYTGNLRDTAGKHFGFELVFFRQAQQRGAAENASAWRIDDLYLAHLALTDVDGRKFYAHKRLNRAGPGIAGASLQQSRIWNGNWSARWSGAGQVLEATAHAFSFRLGLRALKPPVIHGANGVSQKAAGPGQASHYVSLTRLAVDGVLTLGGARHAVTGGAWMDHEWFSHQLDVEQAGWDWFSVQLDNQAELMLFQLRRTDGSIDEHSAGTYVDPAGRVRRLSHREFTLEPVERWKSPRSGAAYPVHWRIHAPGLGLSLEARVALEDQEMVAGDSIGPTYWEGAVTYSGSARGVGYLEMTGYDRPVRLE